MGKCFYLNLSEINFHFPLIQFHIFMIHNIMFRRAEEYLYATISERKHAVEVPKIIHFIWHGKKIPQKYLDNIRLVR